MALLTHNCHSSAGYINSINFTTMKEITEISKELECPEYTVSISKETAEILRQPRVIRSTKYDAFRTLVEFAATSMISREPEAIDRFYVRISTLSEMFGWHRQTTLAFIDELAESDALTFEKERGGIFIHMNSLVLSTAG